MKSPLNEKKKQKLSNDQFQTASRILHFHAAETTQTYEVQQSNHALK